jgi:hypothetical protein
MKTIKPSRKKLKTTPEDGRPPMFTAWQSQYCENSYTTESNLQMKYSPHQNSNTILHGNRKTNPRIHMET